MASPAVAAAPQINGVAASAVPAAAAAAAAAAALSRPDSPASSINSSSKRKREPSDDDGKSGLAPVDEAAPNKHAAGVNGVHTFKDRESLISDFFTFLQTLDTTNPAILRCPLPEPVPEFDGEPSAKRAKSEEEMTKPPTIADKVAQGAYRILDDLMCDVVQTATAQIKKLETANAEANGDLIAQIATFKTQALDLYRRELAYPNVPRPSTTKRGPAGAANPGLVLTALGAAPTLRPLFTGLQHPISEDGAVKPINARLLPNGVTITHVYPEASATGDRSGRSLTLGELFPAPRNLPPLQPPKAPKTTTKSNILTFYHPELTEKSKYRSNTYFSQTLSSGNWLDYSNATPAIHAKNKQRERAQSLAGVKPSTKEIEVSELDTLFRGAFTSFAPSKDDSAAIVPSGQVSRIWWSRVGRRNYEKLIELETVDEEKEDAAAPGSAAAMDIDEDVVKEAVENWDQTAIDPSLDQVFGKKSDHDKEVDDLLEEVSELIETLASFQRNRNLTVPTSQDRYSADPNNGDMLRSGNLAHQPSEEEMMTYETLKAQLSLIIQTLPPYAVARLNSDKLGELAVSTKIEIRSDEYRGVMEEDEPARLARQAAQAAANSNQRQAHRAPSISGGGYPNHQFPPQFTPSARPISNTQQQFVPHTPVRVQGPPNVHRGASSVPIPQQHYNPQARQPPQTQYRQQIYAPQLAKAQGPYGHSNIPQQYVASPTQQRMQPHPQNFNMGQPGGPPRFQQGYPAGYQQHQQMPPQQQQIQQQHPQHAPHPQHPQHAQMAIPIAQHPGPHQQQPPPQSPYMNGGQMPRTISPQVQQAFPYSQSPTPPQQHQQIPRPPYNQQMPPQQQQQQQQQQPSQQRPPYPNSPANMGRAPHPPPPQSNLTGFATVMPEVQQRQVMEQARARADAEQRVSGHMGKMTQGEVVGLAGIGLGGHLDVHKMVNKMNGGGNGVGVGVGVGQSPRMMNGGSTTPVPVPQLGVPQGGQQQQRVPSPLQQGVQPGQHQGFMKQ
ncbi:hypothetical protein QBC44DRAFT_145340 [Cladorrhinum sp. PSN332]|nr:hypothetical protein QBC44DRAFT_145340 [Cladorrhinum sp. PSN332]